ncbi:hypothetical protein [Pseudomonas sp. SG-MS2]|uniref:hypothetical protein n=1 Tax=Pseudomonas sp. SG-MS2 TaxID=1914534 RepID=UPI001379D2AD|nr:hypothetical protein [Pseudomonas sp. SG-MS2]
MIDSELKNQRNSTGCALCLRIEVLMESHFFPKSAYKHVRTKGETEDSPIHVSAGDGDAFYSDNQVTMKLLCSSCEQLFSKHGESVVARLWSTRKGFPFLELIKEAKLESTDRSAELFHSASFPDGVLRGLYYFAVSMIWRAHVWSRSNAKLTKVDLGPYEKIFRDLLLSHGEMRRVKLIVTINVHRSINGVMTTPVSRKMFGRHAYMFEILGIKFHLYVGGDDKGDFSETFNYMGSNVLVMTSREAEAASHNAMKSLVLGGITPRGRLAKESVGK